MFLEISPKACSFIKNETLAQVFSSEFCEISKKIFTTEHLWTTASETLKVIIIQVKESYFLDHVLLDITTLKLQSYNYLHILPLIYAIRKILPTFIQKTPSLPVGLMLLNFTKWCKTTKILNIKKTEKQESWKRTHRDSYIYLSSSGRGLIYVKFLSCFKSCSYGNYKFKFSMIKILTDREGYSWLGIQLRSTFLNRLSVIKFFIKK